MKTKIQWEEPPPRAPEQFARKLVIALLLCLWAASAFMLLVAVLIRAHHG